MVSMNKPYAQRKFHHHGGARTPEWNSWMGAKRRCYSVNNPKYPGYGGRGIKVCIRWQNHMGFQNFLQDMGERPEGMSLDRINNNGDYTPENCRWATRHQQAANKRNNVKTPGVRYSNNPGYVRKWYAQLQVNKVKVLYKRFATEREAIIARKEAEKFYGYV